MKLTIVTGLTALAVLAFMVELLRRRQLQEKYAILWLVVSVVMLPLAFFPPWLQAIAYALPFQTITSVPARVLLGQVAGADLWSALLLQGGWAIVMLLLGWLLLQAAMRKDVIQGG